MRQGQRFAVHSTDVTEASEPTMAGVGGEVVVLNIGREMLPLGLDGTEGLAFGGEHLHAIDPVVDAVVEGVEVA